MTLHCEASIDRFIAEWCSNRASYHNTVAANIVRRRSQCCTVFCGLLRCFAVFRGVSRSCAVLRGLARCSRCSWHQLQGFAVIARKGFCFDGTKGLSLIQDKGRSTARCLLWKTIHAFQATIFSFVDAGIVREEAIARFTFIKKFTASSAMMFLTRGVRHLSQKSCRTGFTDLIVDQFDLTSPTFATTALLV